MTETTEAPQRRRRAPGGETPPSQPAPDSPPSQPAPGGPTPAPEPSAPGGPTQPTVASHLLGLTEEQVARETELDGTPHAHLRRLLRHHRGCPEAKSIGRVEAYPSTVPGVVGGGQVLIIRCQECGAHAREDELD